jgi:predicted nucleotidyltransferase
LVAQGVLHASLFGSVARGEDVPESDIDIILDLDPERQIGLFAFVGIQEFLEAALERDVDLGTSDSLRPERHGAIIAELVAAF